MAVTWRWVLLALLLSACAAGQAGTTDASPLDQPAADAADGAPADPGSPPEGPGPEDPLPSLESTTDGGDALDAADASGSCAMVTGTHTCATPIVVPDQGGEYCGDTSDTVNFYNAVTELIGQNCSVPAYGPDYVFKLTSDAEFELVVTVQADWQPAVYVRTSCTTASSQVACEEAPAGATVGLHRMLDAGTYYLFLDGEASAPNSSAVNRGPFRLTIEIRPR